MTQTLVIHPSHPQQRLIERACDCLRAGGILVYPTDTTYAIGGHMGDKSALDRIRQIRRLDDRHHFTIACRDLSEIALYARVDNPSFRLIKQLTPGPYTFLLPATREAPKRLVHPKRRTIGLRVPDHPILQALLATLGEPIMTTTLQLPDQEFPESDPDRIRELIGRQVDVIIDGGACGLEPTTILDLTSAPPIRVRAGLGSYP